MEPIAKIASACRQVARDVESDRIKMKDLRRGKVFFETGACGCAFGRVIDRAGLRRKMEPYYRRTTSGGKEARWTDNCGAFTAATGIPTNDFDDENPVSCALSILELANDVATGGDRRMLVVTALNRLAGVLEALT